MKRVQRPKVEEEKEIMTAEQYKNVMSQLKELEIRLAEHGDECVRLSKENDFLKKSNASLKGRVTVLNRQVDKYKNLDKEGDEVVESIIKQRDKLAEECDAAKMKLKEYKDIVKEFNELPWYKRMVSRIVLGD